MKKYTAFFLLFIFLFNTAGYLIAFQAAQYAIQKQIKTEIKQGLTISQLTPITIKKNQLDKVDWKDGGKEMLYNGQMYDIVRVVEHEESVTYYCINDEDETRLFENLEEHVNDFIASNKSCKKNSSKKIADNVIKLYCHTHQSIKVFEYHSKVRVVSDLIVTTSFYSPRFIPPRLS